MTETLNADFTQRAVAHTKRMPWQASPSPTVWRKRLDLLGGEAGRVTSVVRYDAQSSFPEHGHPKGEEILVLEGTLSDEHGDYPAGCYLLNPPGFRHAPYSARGCTIFVKLRQYAGARREHVVIDTARAKWMPGPVPGIDLLPLYESRSHPETMHLIYLGAGVTLPPQAGDGGGEFFVLNGSVRDETDTYEAGSWLRLPEGDPCRLRSLEACTLYGKRGHLLRQSA